MPLSRLLTAATFALAATAATFTPAARADNLIMVEQDGCAYCARWNAEIAPIYPKTPEGAFAPLRRIDLRGERPDDLSFETALVVTPTFVLVDDDGAERARIEGYGGDELFWAMLTVVLRDHSDFDVSTAAATISHEARDEPHDEAEEATN
ncbi:hypothetical protein [Celeribacter sp.]|uniref:hypothetical protein n=1 Tax=Celeribacter sp. TaxID=1890673 RepID=UPI003A8E1E55